MSPENEPKSRDELAAEIEAARSDGKKLAQNETFDRTTVIAFGLLFVLPALIIVFAMLFLLPLIARSVGGEPSGATTTRSNASPR
ncbi:MAG: hypothetical protein KY445_12210 [Armatimonadetes bacterium]|nr:hypothetical protein [Armatimonadota bacterium]